MRPFNFIMLLFSFLLISCSKDKAEQVIPTATFHEIQSLASQFSPDSLTINVGDTVRWTNASGFHNVNGTSTFFPNNPESFGNAISSNWTFTHHFTVTGTYDYQCDAHYSMGMTGVIIVQ